MSRTAIHLDWEKARGNIARRLFDRNDGIDVPVRLSVPGRAAIKRLLGFAKRCGVGASANVMKTYGVSISNLLGSAGPDKLVDTLDRNLSFEEHGRVRLQFYPFGAREASAEWISDYDARRQQGTFVPWHR